MANIRIEGLDNLLAKLNSLGGDVEKALKNGVDKSARKVKRDAKLLCAVDTGRLRNSIQSKTTNVNGSIEGVVSTNVEYAPFIEFGTGQSGEGSQLIRPEGISFRHDWKGQPPVPFLYPALIQNQNIIKKDIESEVKKAIAEVCRR